MVFGISDTWLYKVLNCEGSALWNWHAVWKIEKFMVFEMSECVVMQSIVMAVGSDVGMPCKRSRSSVTDLACTIV